MQTVRQWLEQLELSQYVEIFERNAVSLELAKELTDHDLRELGVEMLGHRKLLVRAIGALTALPARWRRACDAYGAAST